MASWTKGQLLTEAFAEIGLASYAFDLQPEEQSTALRRMDSMLAVWEGLGIKLGYAFPATPDGSKESDDSGLPAAAIEPVYLNLAIRLAPQFGKQVSPDTKVSAKQGYSTLLEAAAMPQQQQLPSTLPLGAGAKSWRGNRNPFFPSPTSDPLVVDSGGDLDIL